MLGKWPQVVHMSICSSCHPGSTPPTSTPTPMRDEQSTDSVLQLTNAWQFFGIEMDRQKDMPVLIELSAFLECTLKVPSFGKASWEVTKGYTMAGINK